jgi:hypothetical protein
MRAAETVVLTMGREGCSEAVSPAVGAAGNSSENSLQQQKQSDIFYGDFLLKRKTTIKF